MTNLNTSRDPSYSGTACRLLPAYLLFVSVAWAVDPNRAMSQYVRERWEADSGFPKESVYAISQTGDGYLWIGTERCLVRFDGSAFKRIESPGGQLPPLSPVLGLLAGPDGDLWIQLRRPSLLRLHGGKFEDALSPFDQPLPSVAAMAKSTGGDVLLWTLRREPHLYRMRRNRPEKLLAPAEFPRSPVLAVAQTPNGDLWVGTRDSGLYRIRGSTVDAITSGLPDRKVNALAAGRNNDLWVATDAGVVRWNGEKLTRPPPSPQFDNAQALALLLDRDDNLWVGTNSHGLFRVTAHGVDRLPALAPSPDHSPPAITALYEDREGSIWFADENGLERIRDSAFVTYSAPEGVQTGGSSPLYVDARSRVWFPPATGGLCWFLPGGKKGRLSQDGLDSDLVYSIDGHGDELWLGRQKGGLTQIRLRGPTATVHTYTQAHGLAQNSVYSVHRSRDGTVWAATVNGGVSRLKDGRFTTYSHRDGLASNTVVAMLETAGGEMWFATPDGLSSFSGGRWATYTTRDGLPANGVICLFEDDQRFLWAGTSAGLAVRHGDRAFQPLPDAPLFPRQAILGIAEDRFGDLWMSAPNHVFRVHRDKLLAGTLADGDVREYGLADGLRSVEGVKRHRSVVRDDRGRIWFSLNRGISVADPPRLRKNDAPALVRIESIHSDGQPVPLQPQVHIPGGAKRISFGYRGLSLAAPGRVWFRYQLTGLDATWNDPVTAREAVYTNLAPGSYQFRVTAANPDGAWSPAGASLSFEVDPLFWQTWWFRLLALGAAMLGPVMLYRLRLRQTTAHLKLRFEERLAERTRIAQDLHDTLLQGFISASMQVHLAKDRLPQDSKEKALLSRATELMTQVIAEGRNTVRGLRSNPAGPQDLAQAFTRVPQEYSAPSSDAISFRVISDGEPRLLHPILRDEVYRIGREALINAFRHARADRIELEISYGQRSFTVSIRDNGCGIDPQVLRSGRDGHWGLSGMKERAGRIGAEFHLYSSPGGGTEVVFSLPARIAYRDYQTKTPSLVRFWARLGHSRRPSQGQADERGKEHPNSERGRSPFVE